MAQYATRADIVALGVPSDVIADMSDADVDKQAAAQSSLADGYIAASGKKLPLASWGQDLTIAVAKMTVYSILSVKGYNPEVPGNQIWRDNQQDALGWLKDVAAGRASNVNMIENVPKDTLADRIEAYTDVQRGW